MEQEQLHQPRFGIGAKYLFEAIDAPWPLVLEPWCGSAAVELTDVFVNLR
jgi:hypothetical protein